MKEITNYFNNDYMELALQEAMIAYHKGEVPVGCVIVDHRNNTIIAKTHNGVETYQNPTLHAEIVAINAACLALNSKNLANCDIYITLEPCTMCASALSNARIRRIYYGCEDFKQGAIENGIRFFTTGSCFHHPEIYSNISSEKSAKLLTDFFKAKRKVKSQF